MADGGVQPRDVGEKAEGTQPRNESAKAVAQAENPLRVPYDVALKECVQVAGFVSRYWEPTGTLPGLKRVKARLPASTGEEIISLVHAVQAAQTKLLLLVDPVVVDLGEPPQPTPCV